MVDKIPKLSGVSTDITSIGNEISEIRKQSNVLYRSGAKKIADGLEVSLDFPAGNSKQAALAQCHHSNAKTTKAHSN